MTSTSRTALIALVAIAMAAPACRKNERNFVPAPAANRDGGFAFETAPGTDAIAIPIDRGDGGVAVASGDGDGDGDGDSTGPTEGELNGAEAKDLITFLDQELPADIDEKRLFTKLARKCSETRKCSDKACGSVLASCSGDDVAGCGTMLLGACPAFAAIAAGASGDALGAKTETWVRDLWGDLVVKLRLSLPEKAQGQVDKLAGRHQL